MSELILLEVPFADKDKVKSMGARWNAEIKKWYVPEGIDGNRFAEWIPRRSEAPTMQARAPIYLLRSWERCWKCKAITDVFCLASKGIKEPDTELDSFCRLVELSFVPEDVESILSEHASSYYMDYTHQSRSYYYVNHCECGAKLGDFYMHREPGGAFVPTSEEQAREITMYRIDSLNSIEIDATWGVQEPDLIPVFAKKGKL